MEVTMGWFDGKVGWDDAIMFPSLITDGAWEGGSRAYKGMTGNNAPGGDSCYVCIMSAIASNHALADTLPVPQRGVRERRIGSVACLTVYVTPDLARAVKVLAAVQGRTLSSIVADALRTRLQTEPFHSEV